MCTKSLQRNVQYKKSCAQQNASFMKQIRDYKMPSKLKALGEITVVAYPNVESFKGKEVVDTQKEKGD